MSFVNLKLALQKEGEKLLENLRDLLNKTFTDQFRSCLGKSFYEAINQYKDELVIAESVALHEQLEREKKPVGDTCFWYMDYEKYIKLNKIISDHKKENFEDFEDDLKDFDDELGKIKNKLVINYPSGGVNPSLESIVRIFELVDLELELDEDLYFEIKTFLKRYKVYKELMSV